jgi:hypothetical protein
VLIKAVETTDHVHRIAIDISGVHSGLNIT